MPQPSPSLLDWPHAHHVGLHLLIDEILQPASPSVYIIRFCRELELPGDVENTAISILNQAIAAELTSGRGPTGVAAAAIYIASVVHDQRKTQKTIADTVGVTEVTIRNRYKELAKNLDIVVYL